MRPPLYSKRQMQKTAAFIFKVGENPDLWGHEVQSEAMKQLPFLSDYQVSARMERIDAERGMAYGALDVTNISTRPVSQQDASGPRASIPIIIIDKMVKPFSVFVNGTETVPLTEDRLREFLFDPRTFDLTKDPSREPNLQSGMTPPIRQNAGGLSIGGEMKTAAPKGLLLKIASTIRMKDAVAFTKELEKDASLAEALSSPELTQILATAFGQISKEPENFRKTAHARIKPTVLTLEKLAGRKFRIKTAASDALIPEQASQPEVVSEEQAGQIIGQDNAEGMAPGEQASVVPDPAKLTVNPPDAVGEVATRFGQYRVQDALGKQLIGNVFPNTMSWDQGFSPNSVAVFTNGSAYAMQAAIAGELLGMNSALPNETPRGEGIFYCVDRKGVRALAPVTVMSSMVGPDGVAGYQAMDPMGRSFTVKMSPELAEPQMLSDSEFMLPSTWGFMQLNNQTKLIEDPVQLNKLAKAKTASSGFELSYNGRYNIRGPATEKLAGIRSDLDSFNAMFTLGVLGASESDARGLMKLARQDMNKWVKVAGARTITLFDDLYALRVKEASARLQFMELFPKNQEWTKTAAAVPGNASSVSDILALNFLNPENLMEFVGYVPEFEKTANRLASMLIHSYMGQQELDESSIERAMKNIENVNSTLKSIAQNMGDQS